MFSAADFLKLRGAQANPPISLEVRKNLKKRCKSHIITPFLIFSRFLKLHGTNHRKKMHGDFPKDQTFHVQSFIASHEAELLANWESINSESGTFFKITP